jgi:NAD(P)-dependent dehydrogenase (short-subunit alcohol dehydrogenase family)
MPVLQKAKTASLIFILDGQPESKALWGAYGVSKAATKAMANQFFAELQNSPIRVHAVDPGPLRSALRASVYHSEHPGDVQAPEAAAENIFRLMEYDASGLELELNIQAD